MKKQHKLILTSATSYSTLGYTIFRLNGKHPVKGESWNKLPYLMPDEAAELIEEHGGNYGVQLQPDDLVIDYDPRNAQEGDNPLKRFVTDAGIDARALAAGIKTGGGGLHLYLKKPRDALITKNPSDAALKCDENPKGEIYKGVDFLSKGCYVVGLNCIHPESGNSYAFLKSYRKFSEIGEAPNSLLDILRKRETAVVKKDHVDPDCQDDNEKVVAKYVDYLKIAEPAVAGDSGDQATFWICCRGRDLALSENKITELILIHFNPRCNPPWSAGDIQEKVGNAFKYAKGDKGQALAQYDFPQVAGSKPTEHLHWDKGLYFPFTMTKTLNNTINYLYVGENDTPSPLKDVLVFNEFNGQVRYLKPLPWHSKKRRKPGPDGVEWTDDDTIRLKAYMSKTCGFDISRTVIEEAITEVAHRKSFHPVRDWLQGLKWDGKKRLSTFLHKYAGADDNEYIRKVCRVTLIQAVKRIFQPGAAADTVLVLEGKQGIGKSVMVRMLGAGFYADINIDPTSKDTVDAMRGRWIIEISEMGAIRGADMAALKAFITRKTDLVRPAYAKRTIDLPRQSIFIGTINLDATGEYLTDNTGNRRWLPVAIRQLKFKEFEKVVEQLWAEATDAYYRGEESYITDQKILDMALAEQSARQSSDSWAGKMEEYLVQNKSDYVTSLEMWDYMGGAAINFTTGQARRVAECLRQLGWKRVKKRLSPGENPRWVFVREGKSTEDAFNDLF